MVFPNAHNATKDSKLGFTFTKCFLQLYTPLKTSNNMFLRFSNPQIFSRYKKRPILPFTRLFSSLDQQTLFSLFFSQNFQNTKQINMFFRYPFQIFITYPKIRYHPFRKIVRNRAVCLRIRHSMTLRNSLDWRA